MLLSAPGAGYDLLLTDIRMPIMDGIALALAAAKLQPDDADPADDRLCRPARAGARPRRADPGRADQALLARRPARRRCARCSSRVSQLSHQMRDVQHGGEADPGRVGHEEPADASRSSGRKADDRDEDRQPGTARSRRGPAAGSSCRRRRSTTARSARAARQRPMSARARPGVAAGSCRMRQHAHTPSSRRAASRPARTPSSAG